MEAFAALPGCYTIFDMGSAMCRHYCKADLSDASVRYSRGRTGRSTVTFTAIGAGIPGAVFSIVSRNVGLKLLRFYREV